MAEPGWVVLDTDVWSLLYARWRKDLRLPGWRDLLLGRRVVIATQTRAEVLVGMLQLDLGERRAASLHEQLDATATVPVSEDVVSAYATLTARCRAVGHPLHQKVHTGDRWIAATAIAIGAPLLAGDAVYTNAPDLLLLGA